MRSVVKRTISNSQKFSEYVLPRPRCAAEFGTGRSPEWCTSSDPITPGHFFFPTGVEEMGVVSPLLFRRSQSRRL